MLLAFPLFSLKYIFTGTGLTVIACEATSVGESFFIGRGGSIQLHTLTSMFTNDAEDMKPVVVKPNLSWEQKHGPKIDANGNVRTKFTELTGRPPIVVAGMTPTTSFNGGPLVAACANAGYQVELAAGGLPRRNIFRDHVIDLSNRLSPGAGFAINLLYLNAKQWGFQFPMIPQLVAEGKVLNERK